MGNKSIVVGEFRCVEAEVLPTLRCLAKLLGHCDQLFDDLRTLNGPVAGAVERLLEFGQRFGRIQRRRPLAALVGAGLERLVPLVYRQYGLYND